MTSMILRVDCKCLIRQIVFVIMLIFSLDPGLDRICVTNKARTDWQMQELAKSII